MVGWAAISYGFVLFALHKNMHFIIIFSFLLINLLTNLLINSIFLQQIDVFYGGTIGDDFTKIDQIH